MNLLIVDDSALVRNMIRDSARSIPDIKLYEAANIIEAKLIIINNAIDVAIIDINMPIASGMSLCEWISEDNNLRKKIQQYILTTECGPDLKIMAKGFGVKAWITKPVNPAFILSTICRAFRISQKEQKGG